MDNDFENLEEIILVSNYLSKVNNRGSYFLYCWLWTGIVALAFLGLDMEWSIKIIQFSITGGTWSNMSNVT